MRHTNENLVGREFRLNRELPELRNSVDRTYILGSITKDRQQFVHWKEGWDYKTVKYSLASVISNFNIKNWILI